MTNLDTIFSTIDIIAKEEEAGRGQNRTHSPKDFLKTYQVMEVTVKVSYGLKKNRFYCRGMMMVVMVMLGDDDGGDGDLGG